MFLGILQLWLYISSYNLTPKRVGPSTNCTFPSPSPIMLHSGYHFMGERLVMIMITLVKRSILMVKSSNCLIRRFKDCPNEQWGWWLFQKKLKKISHRSCHNSSGSSGTINECLTRIHRIHYSTHCVYNSAYRVNQSTRLDL